MTIIEIYTVMAPLVLIGFGLIAVRWSRRIGREYDAAHPKERPAR
jgi:hypothetical protein